MRHWNVVKMKLSDLKPADYNPRKISDRALGGLKNSLEKFGMVQPIVWNKRTGNIVGGHQRYKVLAEQGAKDTDVVEVDLDEQEEVELNVTLNNPAIQGEFNNQIDEILGNISKSSTELFDSLRLNDLAKSLEANIGGEEKPDVPPEINRAGELRKKYAVESGDLWQIGEHLLLCGDSTSQDSVQRLMGGDRADAVLTDPPYGQNQPGVPNDAPEQLLGIVSGAIMRIPADNAAAVFFQSTRTFPAVLDEARKAKWEFVRMLWLDKVAQCAYPWRGWILKSEAILVFTKGEPRWNDVHPYSHDVYRLAEVSGELSADLGWHGSVKPLSVVIDICNRISRPGDIVYEPFSGSGTTIMSCQRLGRRCRAIEISPEYVAVTLERLHKETGEHPRKVK